MASFRSLRWWVTARRHPSALLLAVQLAGVLLYPVMEETVLARELAPFQKITDNFPKYLITMDTIDFSQNGIIHQNLYDFLLGKNKQ